ncbi:MAG: hypothetical protein DWI00_07350 [Planctomycetota bacterium]|nr:MAG: hypothetical protein DWI00_07350 [Planctomycetota bacterium]
MFKKLMMAVVPMLMAACSVQADDVTSDSGASIEIDVASISDASVEIVEAGLDVDVDQLAANAGKAEKTDAVEACFRRCGYQSCGWGGNYGCWNSCYNSCYSNYSCYQPYYSYTSYCCVRPVYYTTTVCQPLYQHWGCY